MAAAICLAQNRAREPPPTLSQVLVVTQDSSVGQLATLVLRSPTEQILDDIERAVDDGVNTFKTLVKDAQLLPAGGAVEIELARRLAASALKETGLDQYAIAKFATSLEVEPPPSILAPLPLPLFPILSFPCPDPPSAPFLCKRWSRGRSQRMQACTHLTCCRPCTPPTPRAARTWGSTSRPGSRATCPQTTFSTYTRPSGGPSSWRRTR